VRLNILHPRFNQKRGVLGTDLFFFAIFAVNTPNFPLLWSLWLHTLDPQIVIFAVTYSPAFLI
jgi:hypothetical protein